MEHLTFTHVHETRSSRVIRFALSFMQSWKPRSSWESDASDFELFERRVIKLACIGIKREKKERKKKRKRLKKKKKKTRKIDIIYPIVPRRFWKNRRIIYDSNKQWRLERISSRHKIDSRQQLRFINDNRDSLNRKHNYIVTAWFNDDRRSERRRADLFTLNNTQGTVVS